MSGKLAPKLQNAGAIAALPLVDLLFRSGHARQHGADRKHDLELRPDDVHSPAPDPVFGNGFHKNRQRLTHAKHSIDSFPARAIRAAGSCRDDEQLTSVKVGSRSFFSAAPRKSRTSRKLARYARPARPEIKCVSKSVDCFERPSRGQAQPNNSSIAAVSDQPFIVAPAP
jgi:hypothetical protein